MKNLLKILLSFSIFYSSCDLLNKSFENAADILILSISPDTCDITFIEQISIYRIDSLRFPENYDIEYLKDSLSLFCKNSYDSINLKTFNKDSVDYIVQRKSVDSISTVNSISKKYRIIFASDTLKEIKILPTVVVSNNEQNDEIENEDLINEQMQQLMKIREKSRKERRENRKNRKQQPTQK